MLFASFSAKTTTMYSSQNTWPVGQKGILVQILPELFFYLIFIYRILHLFLKPLNILSTSFCAKMATLHFGRNSWPVGTRSIFVQNLYQLFFSFQIIFHFFLWPPNMLSACFGAKRPTLYSGPNSWPVGQKGIFGQILPNLFMYSILFFLYRIFHLFLRPLNILSTSFRAKMVTLHSCRNSWPVGSRGIFLQIFHIYFFFFRKNFLFFFLDHEIF